MQKDNTAAATHLQDLAAMMAQHLELCLERQLISLGTLLSYYEEAFIHGHEFALPPPFWPDQDFVQKSWQGIALWDPHYGKKG